MAGGGAGLLLVDKPDGGVVFAVIARVRSSYGSEQVGHGGTLDPMASGLLQILVGEATKLVPYLMGLEGVPGDGAPGRGHRQLRRRGPGDRGGAGGGGGGADRGRDCHGASNDVPI